MDDNGEASKKSIKSEFSFAAGLKKMAAGPFEIIGGVFLTCMGIIVTLTAAIGGQEETSVYLMGLQLTGKGFADFFWRGPREMVLSHTRSPEKSPQGPVAKPGP